MQQTQMRQPDYQQQQQASQCKPCLIRTDYFMMQLRPFVVHINSPTTTSFTAAPTTTVNELAAQQHAAARQQQAYYNQQQPPSGY